MTELLAVRNVSKSFAGVHALDDVSLTIGRGEIHCLAGENGSGKSTLIKVISGVHAPDGGTIEIDGTSHKRLTPMAAINAGVQVIYQDFSVFPNLSVLENLALTSELAAHRKLINWRRMRRIAEEAVAKIDFDIDLDEKVGRLSIAEKQLVAISRALMSDAKLIIMDEPTTALTTREVDALFRIILDLKERGISTLFVSHKLEEVFEISEKFTIIRNGRSVATKRPDELDRASFSFYMTGREFEPAHFNAPADLGPAVLEARNLGADGAFADVNFSLHRGEILGITGRLGSGRTELALSLFGALKVNHGEILIKEKPVVLKGIRSAIKHGIGYVPEDRLTEGLFLERSIGANAIISEIDNMLTPLGLLDREKTRTEAQRWVDELKIATPDPENAVNTLSGGNQQRVVLAKWLATQPEVLILNGPTVGVDIGSKSDIHTILQDLARQGMAVIIISDDLSEVIENCSRVLVMNDGRIVAELDPEETSEAELAALMAHDESEEAGVQR